MRLCHSRMQLVQIFPRESQEMVFEAHERAFRFFGGVCRRGIYDNMKAAVSKRRHPVQQIIGALLKAENLTPRIMGSQRVSAPIGVEPARRITPPYVGAQVVGARALLKDIAAVPTSTTASPKSTWAWPGE